MNCYLLLVCFAFSACRAFDINTSFKNLQDKTLSAYSSAVCIGKIVAETRDCNEKYENERKVEIGDSEDEGDIQKAVCCEYWHFLDCIEDAAKAKCEPEAAEHIEEIAEKLASGVSVGPCKEKYPRGSLKCGLPLWAIIAIAAAGAVMLLIVIIVVICVIKKRG